MRMAYNQQGQLMVDHGLGWVPAAPAAPVHQTPLGATPAETGMGPGLVVVALLGLWAVSALISSH